MTLLVLICSLILSLARPVMALEGVGALADQLATGNEIRIVGRTAPWAEVVVVDAADDDRVVATAEIEPTGLFDFRFRLRGELLSQLQIFGVDNVGNTSRVPVPAVVGGEVILPPTIVNNLDDPPSTTRVALMGMSYPGSTITLIVTADGGGVENSYELLVDGDGFWYFSDDDLPAGKYTGVATSESDGLVSLPSQEIYFEILALPVPEEVVETIDRFIDLLPIPDAFKDPESLSRVLAPLVLVPFFGFWLPQFLNLLLRLLYGLLHLLGWRKERRRWGIVYDSLNKHPLSRAIVRLYRIEDNKEILVETEVCGTDGEFAFLPKDGEYVVRVSRSGYIFPSVIVKAKRDGEYINVYHGEKFVVNEGEEVDISVPMDPINARVSWRFYAKKYLAAAWRVLGWVMLIAGVIFAISAVLVTASLINILVVTFYVALIAWNIFNGVRAFRQTSVVKHSQTGKGVANISIAIYEVEFNRLIQRRISDEGGRFLLLLLPGRYKLDVSAVDYVWDKEKLGGYRGEVLVVKGKNDKQMVKVKIYVRPK